MITINALCYSGKWIPGAVLTTFIKYFIGIDKKLMAFDLNHPPSAACLSASMRDLGYSLETAIADLIDNSISACADTIDIICDMSGKSPVVVILDNGMGMTDTELLNAMRHGAGNAKDYRSPQDLGRFGLG